MISFWIEILAFASAASVFVLATPVAKKSYALAKRTCSEAK
jgi:hypothetical protein